MRIGSTLYNPGFKKSSIGVKLYFQSAFWEIPFLSEEANISDRR